MSRFPQASPDRLVVDAHTHCYAGWITDPEAFARRTRESHWAGLHTGRTSLQDWPNPAQWVEGLRSAGVSAAAVLGWYWEHPPTCLEANRALVAFREQTDFQLFPFATIHPGMGRKQLVHELDYCAEHGFCGIGELHPTAQGVPLDSPAWDPVFAFAETHRWPVTVHVTEPIGRPHPGNLPTPLAPLLRITTAFPDLKIILAHWGGLACFHEMNPFVRKHFGNVYYDTAATTLLYDERVWAAVSNVVPSRKILFGSDYPLRPGRRARQSAPKKILREASSRLSPKISAELFATNFLHLLES